MLLTPVSPHSLFDRSLVLEPSSTVEVEVLGDRPAAVAVDGEHISILPPGTTVSVTADAARPVRHVRRTRLPPHPEGQVRVERPVTAAATSGPGVGRLVELAVTDLGIIDQLSLVLGSGMTALTGETGAGKTLVVGAIDLLLGGRADNPLVRRGAKEAVVEGRFDVDGEEVILTRSSPPRAARAPTSTAHGHRGRRWPSRPRRWWTSTASTPTSRCCRHGCSATRWTLRGVRPGRRCSRPAEVRAAGRRAGRPRRRRRHAEPVRSTCCGSSSKRSRRPRLSDPDEDVRSTQEETAGRGGGPSRGALAATRRRR
jgi:hypothetical protein